MGVDRLIEEISIAEMKKQGVQGLADRPNSMTAQYGQSGLSAQALKAWFDKLALGIAERINTMTGNLAGEGGAKYIPTNIANYISLKDLATAFSDGAFAENVLKLYGSSADKVSGQNIKSLQAIINNIAQTLSEHQEYIDNDAGWYAGKDFNSLGEGKIPQKGDLYLITGGSYTLGNVYQYDGIGWQLITNIRGEKGEKGDTSQNFIEHNKGKEVKMFVGTIDEWKAYSDKEDTLFIPTDGETLQDVRNDLSASVDTKYNETLETLTKTCNEAVKECNDAVDRVNNLEPKLYRHDVIITDLSMKELYDSDNNAKEFSDLELRFSYYSSSNSKATTNAKNSLPYGFTGYIHMKVYETIPEGLTRAFYLDGPVSINCHSKTLDANSITYSDDFYVKGYLIGVKEKNVYSSRYTKGYTFSAVLKPSYIPTDVANHIVRRIL